MIGPCVIPYGTGIDYMANMIRCAVGDEIDLRSDAKGAVATRLLAFDAGVIKQLPDFEVLEREYNVQIYHHMEVGQIVNEYHTNIDGCGYVVAYASTIEEAINRVEMVLNIIKSTIF
jgi:biotin carboxylase